MTESLGGGSGMKMYLRSWKALCQPMHYLWCLLLMGKSRSYQLFQENCQPFYLLLVRQATQQSRQKTSRATRPTRAPLRRLKQLRWSRRKWHDWRFSERSVPPLGVTSRMEIQTAPWGAPSPREHQTATWAESSISAKDPPARPPESLHLITPQAPWPAACNTHRAKQPQSTRSQGRKLNRRTVRRLDGVPVWNSALRWTDWECAGPYTSGIDPLLSPLTAFKCFSRNNCSQLPSTIHTGLDVCIETISNFQRCTSEKNLTPNGKCIFLYFFVFVDESLPGRTLEKTKRKWQWTWVQHINHPRSPGRNGQKNNIMQTFEG